MKQERTNETIRPMLRALQDNIASARARRLGIDVTNVPETAPAQDGSCSEAVTPASNTNTLGTYSDGSPRLKARRKGTSSFTTPMPTRSVWERKTG